MNATCEATIRSADRRSLSCIRQVGPGLLMVVATTFLPAAASAVTVIQCVGTETAEFSPGLTLTPKATTISLTEDLSICTGISDPPVTSLFAELTIPATASCLDPLGGLLVSLEGVVYTWNTGDTSTFQFTVTATRAGAVETIVGIGEVTGGLFEGASAVVVHVQPIPNVLNCLGPPGVTETSGPTTLTITLAE